MKYVTCMGAIYKLTNRSYRSYLQTIANGIDSNLELYGKFIGYIEASVTDMTQEEAQDRLGEV